MMCTAMFWPIYSVNQISLCHWHWVYTPNGAPANLFCSTKWKVGTNSMEANYYAYPTFLWFRIYGFIFAFLARSCVSLLVVQDCSAAHCDWPVPLCCFCSVGCGLRPLCPNCGSSIGADYSHRSGGVVRLVTYFLFTLAEGNLNLSLKTLTLQRFSTTEVNTRVGADVGSWRLRWERRFLSCGCFSTWPSIIRPSWETKICLLVPFRKSTVSTDDALAIVRMEIICRFLFADYHRLSSIGGEQALAKIVSTLFERAEGHYGALTTRLFCALKVGYG